MRMSIIAEGNKKTGFGHITRCLAIGQAFEKKGVSVQYIINGDETIKELLFGTKHEIFDWIIDQEQLSGLLQGSEINLIDSYLAPLEIYQNISRLNGLLVSYDDNNRLPYPAGMVLNGALYAELLDYPRHPQITYLLGNTYLPLRKSFWRVSPKVIRKKVKNILVTFGGDDLRDMTPKVIDMLALKYPTVAKTVVIGRAFKSAAVNRNKRYVNTNFVLYPDAQTMKKLMQQADIAVSAAGQTLYELAAIGTPMIGVGIIENQAQNLRACSDAGIILSAGWFDDKNILEKLDFCVKQLLPFNNRADRSRLGRKAVDGLGSRRIANKILEILNEKN